MKTIILLLALPINTWAGLANIDNSISYPSGDSRYVNVTGDTMTGGLGITGQYSGVYGLTVSSNVSLAGGILKTGGGYVGIKTYNATPAVPLDIGYATALDSTIEAIRFGRTDSTLRYHSLVGQHSATTANNQIQFRLHPGGGSGTDPQVTVMTLNGSGNVGIGTTGPSDGKLVVSSGAVVTDGIATKRKGWIEGDSSGIYALNKSGAALSSGTIVMQFVGEAGAFSVAVTTAAANTEAPVGTAYDATCANGAYCRICLDGICPVRLELASACSTSNDLVVTGDEDGRAECKAGTAAEHNQEVGQPASFTAANGDVILMWAHRN